MKSLLQQTFVFLFLLILPASVFAQSDFRPGYVVTMDQDTLRGSIQYRESAKNHQECIFKPEASSDRRTLTPATSLGWHIEDDAMYRRLEVPVSQEDSTLMPVFAEVILEGHASLYKYQSRFFVEKENVFYEMRNKQGTMLDRYGIRYRTNSNEYIGVLTYLFSDCSSITKEIAQSKINEEKLSRVVNAYNLCAGGETISYKTSKKWLDLSFHLVAGYQFSTLSFSGVPSEAEHLFGDYETDNSFVPGMLLEFIVPRINERISFTTGLLYRSAEYSSHVETSSDFEQNTHDVKFTFDQLVIPTGFRFYFTKPSFSPFVEVGFSNTFYLNTTNYWRKESVSATGNTEITEGEAIPFNKHQFGIWGGGGLLKALNDNISGFILVRVERTNGFTRSQTKASLANSEIINTQIAVGIRF